MASSAAPLRQCPPSPTSPQARDPTLDMATIQTGALLYDELTKDRVGSGVEGGSRAGGEGGKGLSWDGRTNPSGANLKSQKIELCVHSNFYVFSFCLGVSRGVCFVCGEHAEGGGLLGGFLILLQTILLRCKKRGWQRGLESLLYCCCSCDCLGDYFGGTCVKGHLFYSFCLMI